MQGMKSTGTVAETKTACHEMSDVEFAPTGCGWWVVEGLAYWDKLIKSYQLVQNFCLESFGAWFHGSQCSFLGQIYLQNNRLVSLAGLRSFKFLKASCWDLQCCWDRFLFEGEVGKDAPFLFGNVWRSNADICLVFPFAALLLGTSRMNKATCCTIV